jgi:hypothetical protein
VVNGEVVYQHGGFDEAGVKAKTNALVRDLLAHARP